MKLIETQYYSHLCACGCGGKIEIKEHHKWCGVPLHIHGHNKGNSGKLHSEETKQKMKKAKIGKKRTEEAKLKTSKSLEDSYKKGKRISWNKGKKASEETRQKMRDNSPHLSGENNPMFGRYGELSGNWQGGKSFEPYSPEFNNALKQQILERDNYTCQDPNCDGNYKKLNVHHIDYDKKNNNPKNLITLCVSCHIKTNSKNRRIYYTKFYQTILEVRCVSVS